jgi:hypothetical protein
MFTKGLTSRTCNIYFFIKNRNKTDNAINFFHNLIDYVGPGHSVHQKFVPMVEKHYNETNYKKRMDL